MNKLKLIKSLIVLSVLFTVYSHAGKNEGFQISFVKLISNPEFYHKKRIVISGVLSSPHNEPDLYMNSYANDVADIMHSFPISSDLSFIGKNVQSGDFITVRGFFCMRNKNVDPSGVIISIDLISDGNGNFWQPKNVEPRKCHD